MGFPYFVKTMWAATHDNGLAAMAYAPCTVNALVADNVKIGIHEITNYPFDEQLTFVISADQSAKFPLKFRIPAWCKSPEIKVNGVAQSNIVPGEFYTILRTWSNNRLSNAHSYQSGSQQCRQYSKRTVGLFVENE
jgi:DUF1680 family protein